MNGYWPGTEPNTRVNLAFQGYSLGSPCIYHYNDIMCGSLSLGLVFKLSGYLVNNMYNNCGLFWFLSLKHLKQWKNSELRLSYLHDTSHLSVVTRNEH